MTALTTLLGLLPLVWATGSGSEIQRPLAAVVLGGLVSAMLLTMIVLPALYYLVELRAERKAESRVTRAVDVRTGAEGETIL